MGRSAPYVFTHAIARRPARSVVKGLRAGEGDDPTYDGVALEHDAYVAALRAAGVDVHVLSPLEDFPDSVFVEDPALTFSEGAILLRPGAPTRAGEVKEMAPTLEKHFDTVLTLASSGYADGGDVLLTPKGVMIGLSNRTNLAGARALQDCLEVLGYASCIEETPEDVLHFKTACSLLDDETMLATESLARSGVFEGFRTIVVPEGEEPAANALRVNDAVFIGAEFARTIEAVDKLGLNVVPLKTGEIGKIDAGLSCMSLRWCKA